MPSTLRGFTITLWLLGAFVVVASIIPGWRDEAGRSVSTSELWATGAATQIIMIGCAMMVFGSLIYAGWPWVRNVLMAGITAVGLSGFVQDDYRSLPMPLLLGVAILSISLGAWYLYYRSDVVDFFRRRTKAEQD